MVSERRKQYLRETQKDKGYWGLWQELSPDEKRAIVYGVLTLILSTVGAWLLHTGLGLLVLSGWTLNFWLYHQSESE